MVVLCSFYHLVYSNYCLHLYCHIHNVSVDAFFGLIQMFNVELWNLHGISNRTIYLTHGVDGSYFVIIPGISVQL